MASEVLKLTAEIVVSHASMTELTPEQLVGEIKEVYNVLSSLEGGAIILEEPVEAKAEAETAIKPPIPLKDIVKDKICSLSGMWQKDENLKSPPAQGPRFNAERILSEI